MSNRNTYQLPGLAVPGAVAPDLVRIEPLFFTSGIRGVNLRSGELPEDPAQQFKNAWRNLSALVEGAGLSTDNVGLVTSFIDSQNYRAHINTGWLALFPDRDNRPARKTTAFPLPAGVAVELQAYGVSNQTRKCVEVRGLSHRDPLPNAVRMGEYIFTSVIVPWDLSTSEPVVGEDAQTDQCFDNMRIIMEEAGGSIDDVVLQWVYLNDFAYQPYMVDVYLEAWPSDQYQAARKTFRYPMGGQIQIQCIGHISGRRSNHEIPGHPSRSDSDGRSHWWPLRLVGRVWCRCGEPGHPGASRRCRRPGILRTPQSAHPCRSRWHVGGRHWPRHRPGPGLQRPGPGRP
jgi:enamine deaminase RidA (YjgF/YER057c/UK114 family)